MNLKKLSVFCCAILMSWSLLACMQPKGGSKISSKKNTKLITNWFSMPDRGENFPKAIEKLAPLSKQEVKNSESLIWEAYKTGTTNLKKDTILPEPTIYPGDSLKTRIKPPKYMLDLGDKTMPFHFIGKGNVNTQKCPLFIALHGGGQDTRVKGQPHASPMNDREWNAQVLLFSWLYPTDALYFIPRMADDHDGRWYYNYCQTAFDQVIRQAILYHNVDPNRIYLIGISEGAYTAYRLGAFMADRWAGANSMAGGEPINNAPPCNMRNLAFRADIGEFDTMFGRLDLNKHYAEALDKLQKEDPQGYTHHIKVHKGKGHGIEYQSGPSWIYQYTRNPNPEKISWKVIKVHGNHKPQLYWLGLPTEPQYYPLQINAELDRETNSIDLVVEKGQSDDKLPLTVYLNDDMLDLDKPVAITINKGTAKEYTVERKVSTMMKTLNERGDPNYMFSAEITIDI
ncbi:MAG: hypothetical protein N4A71_22315 [Carboxylicivirga sp.]|jgi:predicted esterase|nr:hypothetical protein [Carboxylicivirga sp.]